MDTTVIFALLSVLIVTTAGVGAMIGLLAHAGTRPAPVRVDDRLPAPTPSR
ncbi:hypothetical protein GTV32_16950 [Gordonia sp. SID5947]|uniref:hypothetical protein n=1 Tax=Gordonia sp. SID5947 TaxID=2690315 RepID=UPI00136A879A|nr:hypothetical protein [Gordonia sp. SID5947]MYR07880.1 hypothetical protein [Gordonia sp. SID5947]